MCVPYKFVYRATLLLVGIFEIPRLNVCPWREKWLQTSVSISIKQGKREGSTILAPVVYISATACCVYFFIFYGLHFMI